MKISENYIVEIRKFITNYCCLNCGWKGKLSHTLMMEFLQQKRKNVSRMEFSKITKEDILMGTCIFVRDEVGQIIPYKNPARNICTMESLRTDSENLEEIRLRLLNEQGLTYDENGNVVQLKVKTRKKVI